MQKVFVLYNLRPGVTIEQYEAWSREIDQRITPGQNGVIRFEVYRIEGALRGVPHCQIIEDIEVDNHEVWANTLQGPGMAYVNETFGKYADESTLQIVYGSRILPSLHPPGSRPNLP
jgi:hypothetical protein